MTRLEKQRKSLQALDAKIAGLEAQKKRLEHEVDTIAKSQKRDEEILKIYKAGMIFKEAGILDTYEYDGVLEVLEDYRDWLIYRNKTR